MSSMLDKDALARAGATAEQAETIWSKLRAIPGDTPPPDAWSRLVETVLGAAVPFPVHRLVYDAVFSGWDYSLGPPPAWRPGVAEFELSNVTAFCRKTGHASYQELYDWSVTERGRFWEEVIDTLGIRFKEKPDTVLDSSNGPEHARWLSGARFNIADSCFTAPPEQTAVVYQAEGGDIRTMSYDAGDAIAIAMPMTVEAVASYLGCLKAGCVVVSIADSFAAEEIATRLRISAAKAVVTQDVVYRAGKTLPMYKKVVDAGAERAIIILAEDGEHDLPDELEVRLRDSDLWWEDYLVEDDSFDSVEGGPDDPVNILFSSGTTGEPKAIPWNQTTPIKCAMDGHLHHDIHRGDVVAWPTNLGWMMGPWLIFASLVNRASMALYYGSPVMREFCEFVQDSGVTMLGLVPAVVRAWKATETAHGLDWSKVKVFSSTGEPSNPGDYLYLMSLAGYRPVIEYCGGTEIGGGFVSGTVVQNASPSTFSTPTLGLSFYILDGDNNPTDIGELFLVPPSIGLSNRLLNKDHHEVYFEGTPPGPNGELLRRHGDEKQELPGGYYRALGRADDTMNLGGIKVSSAEIERSVVAVKGVAETAAIAVSPRGGGPSQLVIYAVPEAGASPDKFASSSYTRFPRRVRVQTSSSCASPCRGRFRAVSTRCSR
jgi:acetyl-CoA synthetase